MKARLLNTIFLAIIACLLWSSAFVGIKIGLKYTTPLQFAGIRFFLAGLYILPFTGNLRQSFTKLKTNYKQVIRVALFQTFLLYSLFYTGISMVPASLTAIVVGSGPLFVAIIAHLALGNDKLTFRKLAIISLGLMGVVIITVSQKHFSWTEGKVFWGLLILVFSNIASSIGNVVIVKYKSGLSPLLLNSLQLMTGGLALFLLSIPIEGLDLHFHPAEYYGALLWLSFLSAAAFSIWFILLKRPGVKVSDLNIWKFIIPVFGSILSWIILPDEHPALIPIIGMFVIASSLVFLNLNNRKQRKKTINNSLA